MFAFRRRNTRREKLAALWDKSPGYVKAHICINDPYLYWAIVNVVRDK